VEDGDGEGGGGGGSIIAQNSYLSSNSRGGNGIVTRQPSGAPQPQTAVATHLDEESMHQYAVAEAQVSYAAPNNTSQVVEVAHVSIMGSESVNGPTTTPPSFQGLSHPSRSTSSVSTATTQRNRTTTIERSMDL
jgi:hypothetical protein